MEYQHSMFMKSCAAKPMVPCILHKLTLFQGMWLCS